MLHCGARGYLKSHRAQRRLREAYFVAIVTPATKQLRKMLAGLLEQLAEDFGSTPTFNPQQERPAMTDVLISASELAEFSSQGAVCHHRHPQSRRLRRGTYPERRERP